MSRESPVIRYCYREVVSRKPVGFLPDPKNLRYILCYVEELLECGHKKIVYPGESETLTARRRNCHHCAGYVGTIKIGEMPAEQTCKPARKGRVLPFRKAV